MSDEDNIEEAGEQKPKGSKKLLIVGLIAGLLFGGGGVAGFFLMQPEEQEEIVQEEVVEMEKQPELPDYQYARLDKLQLPVFHNGRVLNYAVMDVSMEVIGADDKLLAEKNSLIVRDALLRYYSINSVGREDNPAIVDFDQLSDKIKQLANDEAKRDIVTRVVISESRNF